MPSTSASSSPLVRQRATALAALLGTGMIYGLFGVFVRWLAEEMTLWQQIGLRHVIGFLLVMGLFVLRRATPALSGAPLKLLIPYTLAFPLSVACFTYAVILTKISVAVFALFGASLITAQTIGLVVFQERWTWHRGVVMGLVFLGLGFVTVPTAGEGFALSGLLVGLGSGFLDATANGLRKSLGTRVERQTLVALQMLGGVVIAGVAMLATRTPLPGAEVSLQSWLILGLFGALILTAAYLPLVGFRHLELSIGTVVLASELLFAPAFAILAFREYPAAYEFLGGLFIVAAIVGSQFIPSPQTSNDET